MPELFETQREQQHYESHRILYELAYREYEQVTFDLPGRLRDKAYALLQLYVVTIGGQISLLSPILTIEYQHKSVLLEWFFWGFSTVLLILALFFLRNAIQLRSYDILDSTAIRETASKKFIHPLDLVTSLEDEITIVRTKNADWANELSLDIRRSYFCYAGAIFSLIVCYLLTL